MLIIFSSILPSLTSEMVCVFSL